MAVTSLTVRPWCLFLARSVEETVAYGVSVDVVYIKLLGFYCCYDHELTEGRVLSLKLPPLKK